MARSSAPCWRRSGTFLIALGAAWDAVRLAPRTDRVACRLLLFGSWGSVLGVFLAALLGTRDATPLHGVAESAAVWKEALVTVTLTVTAVGLLACVVMALHGLGRRRSSA